MRYLVGPVVTQGHVRCCRATREERGRARRDDRAPPTTMPAARDAHSLLKLVQEGLVPVASLQRSLDALVEPALASLPKPARSASELAQVRDNPAFEHCGHKLEPLGRQLVVFQRLRVLSNSRQVFASVLLRCLGGSVGLVGALPLPRVL